MIGEHGKFGKRDEGDYHKAVADEHITRLACALDYYVSLGDAGNG